MSLSASFRVTRGNSTFGLVIDFPLKNLQSNIENNLWPNTKYIKFVWKKGSLTFVFVDAAKLNYRQSKPRCKRYNHWEVASKFALRQVYWIQASSLCYYLGCWQPTWNLVTLNYHLLNLYRSEWLQKYFNEFVIFLLIFFMNH